jgi:hypothetical protein
MVALSLVIALGLAGCSHGSDSGTPGLAGEHNTTGDDPTNTSNTTNGNDTNSTDNTTVEPDTDSFGYKIDAFMSEFPTYSASVQTEQSEYEVVFAGSNSTLFDYNASLADVAALSVIDDGETYTRYANADSSALALLDYFLGAATLSLVAQRDINSSEFDDIFPHAYTDLGEVSRTLYFPNDSNMIGEFKAYQIDLLVSGLFGFSDCSEQVMNDRMEWSCAISNATGYFGWIARDYYSSASSESDSVMMRKRLNQ